MRTDCSIIVGTVASVVVGTGVVSLLATGVVPLRVVSLAVLAQPLAQPSPPSDRPPEATDFLQMGDRQLKEQQFQSALQSYQSALALYRQSGDLKQQGTTLSKLGNVYRTMGQYPTALEYYQQAIALYRQTNSAQATATALDQTAQIYLRLGRATAALTAYQQSLAIRQTAGDAYGEAVGLNNLGNVYEVLSQYPKALEYYQKALAARRAVSDPYGEAATINDMGGVYERLGQYPQALQYYHQALGVQSTVFDSRGQTRTLNNIGGIYITLGDYSKALEYYRQASIFATKSGDIGDQATALNNIGRTYARLGQYPNALKLLEQALAMRQGQGDRFGEGTTLTHIGEIYARLGRYSQATETLQQALVIQRDMRDRTGESASLSQLGYVMASQNQAGAAIALYKQAVNVIESIRQEIRTLPKDVQQSYTETVAGTYRTLADLLLSQGRILEAQEVVELLKVQEIQEFTRSSAVRDRSAGVVLNQRESRILKDHGTLIAFGQAVSSCKQTHCPQLSQLNDKLEILVKTYNQTIGTFEQEIRQRRAVDDSLLDPRRLAPKAKEILESQPGTVLIYPFVLENKTWLLWAAQGGIVKSVEVPVSRKQLGETVLEFRRLVQNPTTDIEKLQATSKRLYDWLVQPLEKELQANKVRNLVFSLDRMTRYLPIAALFDGKNYLIDTYTLSTILSADLTDMRDRLPTGTGKMAVLAMGASQFKGFNPLPNVPQELDVIVRQEGRDTNGIYPGLKFLNQAFNFRALRDNLPGHKVLHIATHGAFVPGRPEESYLVLGSNEKLTIPDIKALSDLSEVHLVVLSACETALGGPDQDGVEISGISSYFLSAGAKAVLASLWSVNDASTSELMQRFYSNLASSSPQAPVTKAQALRQAQLSLLQGNQTGMGTQRGIGVVGTGSDRGAANPSSQYRHPYYWAPFVLIGNGL